MKNDFNTDHRPQRADSGRLLSVLVGSLVVGVATLASGLLAQNNDNGGVLPVASGGTSATNANTHDTTLAVDGQVEGNTTDSFVPTLRVSAEGYAVVGVAAGVSADDAEFHSTGTLLVEQASAGPSTSGDLLLQGNGTLNPEIGLGLVLRPANQAMVRTAVLVGSSADQSLESLLSGATTPFAMVAMGDVPSLNLTAFDHQLQKQDNPGAPFRATIVFLSVDPMGGLHLAAVSGITGGGAVELAFK